MSEEAAVFGVTPTSGWTTEAFIEHMNALRASDRELADERVSRLQERLGHLIDLRNEDNRFGEERDRRYTEVADQRAAALTIKELADAKALDLAQTNQTYKDDKADKMRDQSLTQSGQYVTHDDLSVLEGKLVRIIEPLVEYMNAQRGVVQGAQMTTGRLFAYIAAGGTVMAILSGLITFIISATTHTG